MATTRRSTKAQQPAWRSGFERRLREALDREEVLYDYEGATFALVLAEQGAFCQTCSGRDIARPTKYTPDFFLRETGVYVEAKGKFDPRARKLALAFREQYPKLDYRLLFQRDNWLTTQKKIRYSGWCQKHGIPYAVGNRIPKEWYTK